MCLILWLLSYMPQPSLGFSLYLTPILVSFVFLNLCLYFPSLSPYLPMSLFSCILCPPPPSLSHSLFLLIFPSFLSLSLPSSLSLSLPLSLFLSHLFSNSSVLIVLDLSRPEELWDVMESLINEVCLI